MVGKDGYCPQGHLARPELQMQPPQPAPSAARGRAAVPPPPPVPAERDPYTPPGLGPSNSSPVARSGATAGEVAPTPQSDSIGSQTMWSTPAPTGSAPPPPVPSEGPTSARSAKRGKVMPLLVVLGLVAIAALGVVMLGGSAGAANLKYVFSKGETHRYQLDMTVNVVGGNLTGGDTFDGGMLMIMRHTVTDVDQAGVATIEYSVEKLRLTQDGRPTDLPVPPEVVTVKMARDGRIVDVSGAGFNFLNDVNPAAGLFGPESFSPILPRHKVDPGDSWSLDGDAPNPFGEPFHIKGTATLVERRPDAAVIKSVIRSPIDFRIEFAKLGQAGGRQLPPGLPKDAAMIFTGNLSMDLTQSMASKSGFLQSALGDMSMTGTFTLEKVPSVGKLTGVLNMSMQLTMTALS